MKATQARISSIDGSASNEGGVDAGCALAYPGVAETCCGAFSDFCAGNPDCAVSTLAQAENPAAWGVDAGFDICVYESTNVCDGEIAVRTSGVDTITTLYFDATSGKLAGFGNNVNVHLFCSGVVAAYDCDDVNLPASPCCPWTFREIIHGDYDCGFSIADGGSDASNDAADD